MALLYALILFFCLKIKSCQLQCVKESLKDSEFSINVTKHIQVESGDCIGIPYELTFPENKVKVPYKKIWFRTDQQDQVSSTVVTEKSQMTNNRFRIDVLPQGEYEYGFKLEWGCNQTYVFPTKVKVSVYATQKPRVVVPLLQEGKSSRVFCLAHPLCYRRQNVYWIGRKGVIEADQLNEGRRRREAFYFTPTAEDHNTNITCVVEYDYNILAERTVTLRVKFAPKFQNGTQCSVKGKLLVCVCISRGNPPSPITWPVASLTDFSISSYSSGLTVNSTLTMKAADTYNNSVKCISSNELGQREIEIKIGNYTENLMSLNEQQLSSTGLLWIIAVSVSLNLALLVSLIICIYKWGKRSQQKPNEETNTYATLNRAQLEQEYSVIPPRPK
ncbi:sialic acid-binding Ig-like lectin 10 [Halichoeres trimaculatus]|uniref:sialic acid-binding Ig-like lectin 10 n=1 Tax=Halichoeres trimaculatus TaxID=147232 RepID=UPI003D9DF2B5